MLLQTLQDGETGTRTLVLPKTVSRHIFEPCPVHSSFLYIWDYVKNESLGSYIRRNSCEERKLLELYEQLHFNWSSWIFGEFTVDWICLQRSLEDQYLLMSRRRTTLSLMILDGDTQMWRNMFSTFKLRQMRNSVSSYVGLLHSPPCFGESLGSPPPWLARMGTSMSIKHPNRKYTLAAEFSEDQTTSCRRLPVALRYQTGFTG